MNYFLTFAGGTQNYYTALNRISNEIKILDIFNII